MANKNKTNKMNEVIYSITCKDFSTNFSLDVEEHKVTKETEKVYSVTNDYEEMWDDDGELVPNAATELSYYLTNLVDLYCGENFSEEENRNFNIAQYCLAYLNMTTEEERKEIGLEVVIKEPSDIPKEAASEPRVDSQAHNSAKLPCFSKTTYLELEDIPLSLLPKQLREQRIKEMDASWTKLEDIPLDELPKQLRDARIKEASKQSQEFTRRLVTP